MKNVKMFAVVFALVLSVVGVFARPTPDSVQGKRDSDCQVINVDNDCDAEHHGASCTFSEGDVLDMSCSAPLKRTI